MSKMNITEFFTKELAKFKEEGFSEKDLLEIFELKEDDFQSNNNIFWDDRLVALY